MDHTDDIAAIRAVIADIEAGFNENDPELSVAHFADGSTVVDVAGRRVSGRAALLDDRRAALAGPLRDQHARYELGEVTFLGEGVAIAHVHATATDPHGAPLDVGPAMIALYVFVRADGGRWRVAARQDTVVRP